MDGERGNVMPPTPGRYATNSRAGKKGLAENTSSIATHTKKSWDSQPGIVNGSPELQVEPGPQIRSETLDFATLFILSFSLQDYMRYLSNSGRVSFVELDLLLP